MDAELCWVYLQVSGSGHNIVVETYEERGFEAASTSAPILTRVVFTEPETSSTVYRERREVVSGSS